MQLELYKTSWQLTATGHKKSYIWHNTPNSIHRATPVKCNKNYTRLHLPSNELLLRNIHSKCCSGHLQPLQDLSLWCCSCLHSPGMMCSVQRFVTDVSGLSL